MVDVCSNISPSIWPSIPAMIPPLASGGPLPRLGVRGIRPSDAQVAEACRKQQVALLRPRFPRRESEHEVKFLMSCAVYTSAWSTRSTPCDSKTSATTLKSYSVLSSIFLSLQSLPMWSMSSSASESKSPVGFPFDTQGPLSIKPSWPNSPQHFHLTPIQSIPPNLRLALLPAHVLPSPPLPTV